MNRSCLKVIKVAFLDDDDEQTDERRGDSGFYCFLVCGNPRNVHAIISPPLLLWAEWAPRAGDGDGYTSGGGS